MNFLIEFYREHREELIQYGYRFDHGWDTAEALFEDCHDKLCEAKPLIDSAGYVNYMKRIMGNLYKDQLGKAGYLVVPGRCKYPEQFSPKPMMALDEKVCQKEELGFLRMALGRMSQTDQEILLSEGIGPVIKSYRKYQATKRLERNVIAVMAEQKERHLQEQRQEQTVQDKVKKEGKQ